MKNPIFAAPLLAAIVLGASSTEAEPPAAPSASAAVVQAASPEAPIASYAWPKETSAEPKEAEWATATVLETARYTSRTNWAVRDILCRQTAIREWVRVTCVAPQSESGDDDHFFGSVWAIAGDASSASGKFELASTLERYKKPAEADNEARRLTRLMGANATLTFQVKYGSASVLRVDEIHWEWMYDGGGNVITSPGMLVEVSWALGEKYPTFWYHW